MTTSPKLYKPPSFRASQNCRTPANEMVPAGVYQRLQTVSGLRYGKTEAKESEPVRPVHDTFVEAVRPFVARQIWAMVELQRLTGMRPGEVVRMRGCDLNMTADVWTYTPARHKTQYRGFIRTIYLGPRAKLIVKQFLKKELEAFLFSPADAERERRERRHAERKTPQSCGNRPGTNRKRKPRKVPGLQYTVDSYRRAIDYEIKKAKVPHWHPHQLRHNAATNLRREFGIEAARVILGHKSPAITECYAELDHSKAIEIAARIG